MSKKILVVGGGGLPSGDYVLQNYARLLPLIQQWIAGRPVQHWDMDVHHDDDCPLLLGDGRCRCNCTVLLRNEFGETKKRFKFSEEFPNG